VAQQRLCREKLGKRELRGGRASLGRLGSLIGCDALEPGKELRGDLGRGKELLENSPGVEPECRSSGILRKERESQGPLILSPWEQEGAGEEGRLEKNRDLNVGLRTWGSEFLKRLPPDSPLVIAK